jgi:hypothetical protein
MIDFKISAVLNPKSKKSSEGETIYLCINQKGRQYINLNLEKIPKNAWSGKPLKWVNSQYLYADFHNRVIAREIQVSVFKIKFSHLIFWDWFSERCFA